uniref:J domain-containing protein n=1 Tax=Trichuris muris TaxID=70415 RepID=A0A5S6QE66_TRIMR
MASQQFEYDERGSTFYFFIASFYACVLIPVTYYFWPKENGKGKSEDMRKCHCEPCLIKESARRQKEPYQNLKRLMLKFYLFAGWLGLLIVIYKAVNIEIEGAEYDPYAVLGLSPSASAAEIRKQYHALSLKHHPDRGGNSKLFVAISKAYQALTDEETRRNYEEYGNPDGPGALRFGIALPSWLISKEYAFWVIGLYVLVFMVILPVVVGTWWFRSIKYNPDSVLLDTTQLYFYMFHKTPLLIPKRLIMILAGSFEFCRSCNSEIVERPSDDVEVPNLIKMLLSLGEHKKERPLCYPYSIKARALLHAHFNRLPLPVDTLQRDLNYVLKKCPPLIQEMTNIYLQLVAFAVTGRVARMPALETLDNVMKLSGMIVQAVWDNKSPLLQLPYFGEDTVRYLQGKKRNIRTCADLAQLDRFERRQTLKVLNDRQYNDVMCVLSSMPRVEMQVTFEVQDEDDRHTITAGAFVTCIAKMQRKPLVTWPNGHLHKGCLSGSSRRGSLASEPDLSACEQWATEERAALLSAALSPGAMEVDHRNAVERPSQADESKQTGAGKRKVWEKPKKRRGGKPKKKQTQPKIKPADSKQNNAASAGKQKKADGGTVDVTNQDDSNGSESDVSGEGAEHRESAAEDNEEEDELLIDEMAIKRERKILETVSKVTHPVHCPYFPEEKYEWWWIFICDRKRRLLISPPVHVTNLVDEVEVELKFPAPNKPGRYSFQVCLRSDSYLDCDQVKEVKFEVFEARQIVSHPQWDFTEERTDEDSDVESEYTELEEDDGDESS